jgi:predicted dithiol-disulfide oxidoreductase (DUF899 family)
MPHSITTDHRIVSRQRWLQERRALLAEEKEMTRLRDHLSEKRRALPWVRVDKSYVFETPNGTETLADLFGARSQLIIKHFMLAPGQTDPCVGCSFEVDHIDGVLMHIQHHDVSYVAVARAPLAEIEAVKRRMNWRFRWVSSFGTDFNYDFGVSFTPAQVAGGKVVYNYRETDVPLEDLSGLSIFFKDESGAIFHTYSAFGRGAEEVLGAYMYLDLTPKGRNENGPNFDLTDWVRHHDRYGADGRVNATGRWEPAAKTDCCHSS